MLAWLQDLVLPQMKAPGQYKFSPLLGTAPLKRDILLMFRWACAWLRASASASGVRHSPVGILMMEAAPMQRACERPQF